MATNQFLIVCESFYSIQGEGVSQGVPAVFLRLSGCNLRCNGFSYKDPKTHEHLGCDSKQVWLTGTRRNFDDIIDFWAEQGWLAKLKQGAHLVITGGEPLLQQRALVNFIQQLDLALSTQVYLEVETNATIAPNLALIARINQFNVSPKLQHSGETVEKAYNLAVLKQFAQSPQAVFKFVIASQEDIEEVIKQYVERFKLPPAKIWLMPEGGTREAIDSKKAWLVELCKAHCFNFTSRLQIDIWQEVVGV